MAQDIKTSLDKLLNALEGDKTALAEKEVTVAETVKHSDIPALIESIEAGGGVINPELFENAFVFKAIIETQETVDITKFKLEKRKSNKTYEPFYKVEIGTSPQFNSSNILNAVYYSIPKADLEDGNPNYLFLTYTDESYYNYFIGANYEIYRTHFDSFKVDGVETDFSADLRRTIHQGSVIKLQFTQAHTYEYCHLKHESSSNCFIAEQNPYYGAAPGFFEFEITFTSPDDVLILNTVPRVWLPGYYLPTISKDDSKNLLTSEQLQNIRDALAEKFVNAPESMTGNDIDDYIRKIYVEPPDYDENVVPMKPGAIPFGSSVTKIVTTDKSMNEMGYIRADDDIRVIVTPEPGWYDDLSQKGDESIVGFCMGNTYYISTQKPGKRIGVIDGTELFKPVIRETTVEGATVYIPQTSVESIDISNMDFTRCTSLKNAFYYQEYLTEIIGIESINTHKVTSLEGTFYRCDSLTSLDLNSWDTGNVTTLKDTFYWCDSLTSLDLNSWDTGNVTTLKDTFFSCDALTLLNVSSWNVSKVTDMSQTFHSIGESSSTLDLSSWDTSHVTNMKGTFESLHYVPKGLSTLNTSQVTNMSYIFYQFTGSSLNINNWDVHNVQDFSYAFGYLKLSTIDLSRWDMRSAKTLEYMFEYCENLTDPHIGDWNVSNVTDMTLMFYRCHALTTLDLNKWNTGNVQIFDGMFSGCENLVTLNIGSWNTQSATYMGYIFEDCASLTGLDLSSWKTGKVTDMSHMFDGCRKLKSLDFVMNWDVSKVQDFEGCFSSTFEKGSNATLNLSYWQTSSATTFRDMFEYSYVAELDLRSWSVSNVTDAYAMFENCSDLKTIYCNSNWTTNSKISSSTFVFYNCKKLTNFSSNHITGDYCKPISSGGYFTSGAAPEPTIPPTEPT